MDESELTFEHFRGMWSVTGRGISVVAPTRATALSQWSSQAGVSLARPPAHLASGPEPVLVGTCDPEFWARFLH